MYQAIAFLWNEIIDLILNFFIWTYMELEI